MNKEFDYFNLGLSHYNKGNFKDAEYYYNEAIKLNPAISEFYQQLGLLMYQQGNFSQAIQIYSKAINLNPNNANLYSNKGNMLFQQGDFQEAILHYNQAIKLNPDNPDFYNNLALVQTETKLLHEAKLNADQAIRLNPENAEYYYTLGLINQNMTDYSAAIENYSKAIKISPEQSDFYASLGKLFMQIANFEQAKIYLSEAIRLEPDNPYYQQNLGRTLYQLGNYHKAIEHLLEAFRIEPGNIELIYDIGAEFKKIGKYEEAEKAFLQALQLNPDYPELHYSLAILFLLTGKFREGWQEFEWRFQMTHFPIRRLNKRYISQTDFSNKRIYIHYEQGLGDTFQFLRYLPLFKTHDKYIIFECQKGLKRLLQNTEGFDVICEIMPSGETITNEFDISIPLMSMAKIFDTQLETIPQNIPYIKAETTLSNQWKIKFENIDQFKIGIVWEPDPLSQTHKLRSCPLAFFEKLAEIEGVKLFSLQKGIAVQQLKALSDQKIIDLDSDINDFADTAAIIDNLDLVISIDTSVAHLAGAMSKAVWTLLPYKADWRWLLDREDSPWYPTMKLFRQTAKGDWDSVFTRVKSELLELIKKNS